MITLVPNSWGSDDLREFNPCHNPAGAGGGQFCSSPGGSRGQTPDPAASAKVGRPGAPRPTPKRTSDIDEAVRLILKGEVVELDSPKTVNTVLTKLAAMAQDAERLGEKAPKYDLCKVSVAGTNLFCGASVKTEEFPEGLNRLNMPQLAGKPVPGSAADQLPKNKNGSVNGAEAFVQHLRDRGIGVAPARAVAASSLKASQGEMDGPTVAGMMTSATYNPAAAPIFISRDGYVVDGHHRWAAVVGQDAADNRLGDSTMDVVEIDAPIAEVLHIANVWSLDFGIARKQLGQVSFRKTA